MTCPHCGGTEILTGLRLRQGIEVGPFGLEYRAAKIFSATEMVHADLCSGCGTIVRLYVDDKNRNWIT